MVRDARDTANIVKSIIVTRSRDGASILNIKRDYFELAGEPWPIAEQSLSETKMYLEGIKGVYSVKSQNNEDLWFIESKRSQHIIRMILEQNPGRVSAFDGMQIQIAERSMSLNGRYGAFSVFLTMNK